MFASWFSLRSVKCKTLTASPTIILYVLAVFVHSFVTMFQASETQERTIQDNPKKGTTSGCQHDKPTGRSPRRPAQWNSLRKPASLIEIWKMRHPHQPPKVPHSENKRSETEKDVVRRAGREEEELCQGLKIHFEVGFREMVLAACTGSSPAGLELKQPSWQWLLQCSGEVGVALQGTSVCWDLPFPLSHCCTNATSIFFHTVYLWSETYCSVDQQCKHPHNLEQNHYFLWLYLLIGWYSEGK